MSSVADAPTQRALVVYGSALGVRVYDIAADATATFKEAGGDEGLRPRFRTGERASFIHTREPADATHPSGQDSVWELNFETGVTTELVRLPGLIGGYDWSADGSRLAYELRTETADAIGPELVCLFDARSGTTSLLGSFDQPFGTSTGQREESSVTWSPDDRLVLAVETSARPSVLVVDTSGRSVIAPRDGTFARWLSDTTLFLQEDPHDASKPWKWAAIDSTNERRRPFALPSAAFRPAVSPRGDQVLFDDGQAQPMVFLLDVKTGVANHLSKGYVAPVWFSSREFAATAVSPSETDGEVPWIEGGRTTRFDVQGLAVRDIDLLTTLQDPRWYGVVDVLLPGGIG